MNSTIPSDASFDDQPTMNCFAWQEFIAVNWGAAPGKRGVADLNEASGQFGDPNAPTPKVWETYKADAEVMLSNAAAPKNWDDAPPPPVCRGAAAAFARRPSVRALYMTSPFGDFSLGEVDQASGQWLADQSGNLIWYEIRLNRDEFNSIVANRFYDATVQQSTASTGKNPTGGQYQVKLPSGSLQGPVGAMELKAAWRILTDPSQYRRYLTSQAALVGNGSCTSATMGLVGLHIIHKTETQPQWIWATFEQVDNVPPASPATFNSASCQCRTAIPSACLGSSGTLFQNCSSTQKQGETCTPNISPPYNSPKLGCPAYPIEVTRGRAISNSATDPVAATNQAAQQLIRIANANSVFQYYQLVDVLWSTSPQDTYTNSPGTPGPTTLSISGADPNPLALPVANTTLETYVQTKTCMSCHIHAKIAGAGEQYASDFSFVLGMAQSPSSNSVRPRRALPAGLVTLRH